MTVSRDFSAWPRGALHVAIGVFDGVHIGHQTLIRDVARRARNEGATPVVTTFDPLPIEVLAPGAPPSTLSDIDERCALLERFGAQHVAIFTFTKEFAAQSPEEFARRVAGAGRVRRVSVGEDFKFGRDRGGDVHRLAEFGKQLGFECDVAKPVMLGDQVVSSTRVRNALVAGDVEHAGRLLGRPYAVAGGAAHGGEHGRALGFPTVDVSVPSHRLLPRDGIYAVWAEVERTRVKAAASVGVRPTAGGAERTLELYLLDWSGDTYGDRVRCEFVKRLRDELRFEGAAEVAQQIKRDVEQTRRALR